MCEQFKISGRVQGVFFRDSTRNIAASLNLQGHAINLPDGSVEVIACGAADAIDSMDEWLQAGPPMARVTSVKRATVSCAQPGEFTTG